MPLLADFHPKGGVATQFGHYIPDAGIGDRATVMIDKSGVVRHSESVTPAGHRSVDDLVAICEGVHREHPGEACLFPKIQGVPAKSSLFIKSRCGPSRRALVAIDNLGLADTVAVRNVHDDAAAAAELLKVGGKDQAPCLVIDDRATYESADLIAELAQRIAPVC